MLTLEKLLTNGFFEVKISLNNRITKGNEEKSKLRDTAQRASIGGKRYGRLS